MAPASRPARRRELSLGMDQRVVGRWSEQDRVRPLAAQELDSSIQTGHVLQGTLAEPQPAERLFVPAHRLFIAGTAVDELPCLSRHFPGCEALEIAETYRCLAGFESGVGPAPAIAGGSAARASKAAAKVRAGGHEQRIPARDVRHTKSLQDDWQNDIPMIAKV